MTDKPRTMMLGPHEWRALVMAGTTTLYNHAQARSSLFPTSEEVSWFHEQLDRLKMQVSAWGASGQPSAPVPEQPAMTEYLDQLTGAPSNGTGAAAAPKKKRGWQKGRKRGPRKPKGNEAVQ